MKETKQHREARYICMWLEYNNLDVPERLERFVKGNDVVLPYSFADLSMKLLKVIPLQ